MATRTLVVMLMLGLLSACADSDRRAGVTFTSAEGVAIGGYDPVAYFTEGAATKGSPEYSAEHGRATWWFANAEHRDSFIANPKAYTPAYGGWCAYGVAEGYAAETDPVNGWTIYEGRLYLNWDAEVAAAWNADRAALLEKSEAYWPGVNQQLSDGSATVHWH
ncbi:MAG: YHS domain-containing (seleno)protein [Pseudomonadota bacterium]